MIDVETRATHFVTCGDCSKELDLLSPTVLVIRLEDEPSVCYPCATLRYDRAYEDQARAKEQVAALVGVIDVTDLDHYIRIRIQAGRRERRVRARVADLLLDWHDARVRDIALYNAIRNAE